MILLYSPLGVGAAAHILHLVEYAPKRLQGMVGVTLVTSVVSCWGSGEVAGVMDTVSQAGGGRFK